MILKLDPSLGPVEERVGGVTAFVAGLYPSAALLSDNGGLLTYTVPGAAMKAGAAFAALESAKAALGISDYAVAQPTLEQVSVRARCGRGAQGSTVRARCAAAGVRADGTRALRGRARQPPQGAPL